MFQVEVILFLVVTQDRNENYILMSSTNFPTTPLLNKSALLTAADMLKKYTTLEAFINGVGWVPLSQKNIIEDISNHKLSIPFIGMIPQIVDIQVPDVKWLSLNKLSLEQSKLLQQVLLG